MRLMGQSRADEAHDHTGVKIAEDLSTLGQRAGFDDPKFSDTYVIQNSILPGSRQQQVSIYKALILNNINAVDPNYDREALYVGLNIREGYDQLTSGDRLVAWAKSLGRTISRTIKPGSNIEHEDSRSARNNWRHGRKQLAAIIWQEIQRRNEEQTWHELLGEDISKLPDGDATAVGNLASAAELPHDPIASDGSRYPTGYIHRPDVEERFRRLLDRNARIIVLVGQPGMGKTWLAKELTRDPGSGKPAPFMDASTQDKLIRDLAGVFAGLGFTEGQGSGDPVVRLAMLICDEHAPSIVLLDNLDSADQLLSLLPSNFRSVVVATCRTKGDSHPQDCEFIEVPRMTRPETVELVLSLAPGSLTHEEAEQLAQAASDHPLLIRHACTLFAAQTLSMEQFCQKLEQQAADLVGQIHTSDGAKLQVVIQHLAELTAERDPLAYDMLVCISMIGRAGAVYKSFLAQYVMEGSVISDLRIVRAFEVLHDSSLCDEPPSQLVGVMAVFVHSLTWHTLRQLFDDKLKEVYERSLRCTSNAAESSLPIEWALSILALVNGVFMALSKNDRDFYKDFPFHWRSFEAHAYAAMETHGFAAPRGLRSFIEEWIVNWPQMRDLAAHLLTERGSEILREMPASTRLRLLSE